jgi:hypothetical protein
LASRQRRTKQLEAMLDDGKERLADHHNSVRLLSEKERVDLEKKVGIYQRKIESMQSDLDELEVERILKREKLRDERYREHQKRRERRSEL